MSANDQKKAPATRGGEGKEQGHARTRVVYPRNEAGSRPRGVDERTHKGLEAAIQSVLDAGYTRAEIFDAVEVMVAKRSTDQRNLRSAIEVQKKPEKPDLTDEQRAQRKAKREKFTEDQQEAKILRSCVSEIVKLRSPDPERPWLMGDEEEAYVALRLDMATGDDVDARMRRTAASCGQWTTRDERRDAILKVKDEKIRRYNGAELGKLLRLTNDEWLRLPAQYRTITPFDISKAERDRINRDRRNARRREKRAEARGSKARKRPSIAQIAEANGVSKRTVYYRKAAGCLLQNSDGMPKVEKLKRGRKSKRYRR